MILKDLAKCGRITATDGTHLSELLHPARDSLELSYSIAHAEVLPGASSLPHRLKKSSEVYFIMEGRGEMHIDEEQAQVDTGQAIFIPPGSWQYICNTGNIILKFLCIVSPVWRAEDEELKGQD
ncbi:Cupin domain protein [uncultured archaeon]|nr:Cupin domain protein [uncultured archaeon]